MQWRAVTAEPRLRSIPVVDVATELGAETLLAERDRANALVEVAVGQVPRTALRALDAVSRRWLARWKHAELAEIDRVAEILGRPGAYYLCVSYEWGCTCRVAASPGGASARLARVLDWRTPGLGEHVIAARVRARAGAFVSMTWPGYTGVLQGMAPGRFAAALNQAPMRRPIGLFAIDWAANKARLWSRPHPMPGHLLREVFETSEDFNEAKRRLTETPIAASCIFVLAGTRPDEVAVIERDEESAEVHDGAGVAANHWQAAGWRGTSRGLDSKGRAQTLSNLTPEFDESFGWLRPPVLNPLTRLAMVADAAEGRILAQGYECEAPATAPLDLTF